MSTKKNSPPPLSSTTPFPSDPHLYLFEHNPVPMFIWDFETRLIIDCNEAALLKYGYTREEFLQLSILDIRPEEDRKLIAEYTASEGLYTKFGEKFHQQVWRHLKKSGELMYVEVTGRLIDYKGRRASLVQLHDVTLQHETEQKLRSSEEKYKLLFHASPQPKWIFRRSDFRILEVNEAAVTHYGYTREEFLAMTILDFRPKGEVPKVLATHDTIGDQVGIIQFGVFTHYKKGNIPILVEVRGSPIKYENEDCVMILCNDVTEKERYLQDLEKSEQKLRTATAIARLGYWQQELDKNRGTWSDEVYKIWGRERSTFQVNYQNFLETIHPADLEPFSEAQALAFQGIGELDFVHRILLPDGSIRWVHELGKLTRAPDGTPLIFEGTVQDITQQKLEEQKLKLLVSVVTHANEFVIITEAEPFDEPGPRIVYVNDAFTRITGYSKEEVIGKTPRILQGPKTDQAELRKLSEALRKWEPCEVTVLNYKKSGEEFWNNFSVSPVADENGWFTHWISVERDVTARKNQELQKVLLTEISQFFQQEPLKTALTKTVDHLAEFGNFILAEVWLLNTDKDMLRLSSTYLGSDPIQTFYLETQELQALALGQGLAGQVWEKRKPLIWGDLPQQTKFLRTRAAKKLGLQSMLGIPLISSAEVLGVLVVGKDASESSLRFYETLFTELEQFLGSEINRKLIEEQLNQFFSYAPDLLCIGGPDGYFRKVNPAFTRLLGYTEEELLTQPFSTFIHPDDHSATVEELKDATSGQVVLSFENRYRTKSGEYRWISWSSSAVISVEGLVFGYGKDVTETRKLKDLLDKANRLAKIGGWEVNLVTNTVYWSEITREIHEVEPGFQPQLNAGIEFYKEGESRKTISHSIKEALRNGESWDVELLLVTAKGNERWVRSIGQAEFQNGTCVRLVGSFQDIHDQKILELQIREILESISDAFYALDQDWNFTYFNKQAEKLLHRKEAELLGKNVWTEFPEAAGSSLEQAYRRIASSGQPESFEFHFAGDNKWYEVNAYPFRGGVSVYFKNIDERKKAAAELERAYEERNTVLESIGDGFFAVDRDWIVTYWNKEAEKLLKTTREEIVGNNLWEVFQESAKLDFLKPFLQDIEIGKNVTFEDYFAKLDIWVEFNVYPTIKGLSIYFKDITLRRAAEEEIRQSNERFEKVTQATNDAIWDWNIASDTLYWGSGFRAFGYDPGREIPTIESWTLRIHPEDVKAVEDSLDQALKTTDTDIWQQEYRYKKHDDTYAHVIDRGVIMRNKNGEAIRMVGAVSDITYRKEFERSIRQMNEDLERRARELAASNEELAQFAYVASHDLQEPLRMISSFLTLLQKRMEPHLDERSGEYLFFAVDGAKRMRLIILDLLEYSRVGRLQENIQSLNLNEIVQDVCSLHRRVIEEKSAVIRVDSLPTIKSYHSPIHRVFLNLISNALKYAKEDEPPVIEITSTHTDSGWTISIKDNGIGIEKQFYDKIFIIFQRLHTKQDYGGGTGIGLAIVKKIIASLGGKIWVESKPGQGSTFHFTLKDKA